MARKSAKKSMPAMKKSMSKGDLASRIANSKAMKKFMSAKDPTTMEQRMKKTKMRRAVEDQLGDTPI